MAMKGIPHFPNTITTRYGLVSYPGYMDYSFARHNLVTCYNFNSKDSRISVYVCSRKRRKIVEFRIISNHNTIKESIYIYIYIYIMIINKYILYIFNPWKILFCNLRFLEVYNIIRQAVKKMEWNWKSKIRQNADKKPLRFRLCVVVSMLSQAWNLKRSG